MDMNENSHKAVGDLIEHLRSLFGKLADRSLVKIGTNGTNVTVLYSRKHRSQVKFEFFTPDNIKVDVKVDLNDISKDYIRNTMEDLIAYIEAERQKRQSKILVDLRSPIANGITTAIAGVKH